VRIVMKQVWTIGTRIARASALRWTMVMATLLTLVWPAVCMAQAAPAPTLNKTPKVWVGYLFIFVFLVITLGVSLMPSKRSHQD
jgi:hypothetical protein